MRAHRHHKLHCLTAGLILMATAVMSHNSWAMPTPPNGPSRAWVQSFVASMKKIYQPDMKEADLDWHFAHLSPELEDHHVAYDVVLAGADGIVRSRAGLKDKARSTISYEMTVEDVMLGSNTVVIAFREFHHFRRSGQTQRFQGRTILVVEFDEMGRGKVTRRYLD